MDHYALRKYRGPATWALVRDAYLAGEPAPIVAKRYDVSLANLRRKALREGWTRRAHAKATDRAPAALREAQPGPPAPPGRAPGPPRPDPHDGDPAADAPSLDAALQSALGRAAADLVAGRSAEALAALKAGEALQRLAAACPASARLLSAEERADAEAQERAEDLAFRDRIIAMAESLALAALSDPPCGVAIGFAPWLYRWRAAHLGEEAARADYLQGVAGGWGASLWDEHGALRPPKPVDPAAWCWTQHARACEARQKEERPWMRED